MEPDYSKAKKQAEKIIEENCILEPPIKIIYIAENYGLTVFISDFENPKQSGILNFDEKIVHLNRADHAFRQRFTAAHELGHFLMHKDLGEKHIERRSPILGDKEWYEKEADAFAAHLLVPLHFLKKELSVETVRSLSKKYQVSEDVIGYQLKRIKK